MYISGYKLMKKNQNPKIYYKSNFLESDQEGRGDPPSPLWILNYKENVTKKAKKIKKRKSAAINLSSPPHHHSFKKILDPRPMWTILLNKLKVELSDYIMFNHYYLADSVQFQF